jgi:hypothetical protein
MEEQKDGKKVRKKGVLIQYSDVVNHGVGTAWSADPDRKQPRAARKW